MPCTGPAMPTEEEVTDVTNDVISYLREKHNIFMMPEKAIKPHGQFNRLKGLGELRLAIKEMMKQTACEEF